MVVTEKAYAKINLGLKILRKRDDGYHDILSLFQTVHVHDTLYISDKETPGLESSGPDVPQGEDNLILRAEKVFTAFLGINTRAHFQLNKRIPLGAGLGGGSADAAAALRGLRRFYHAHSLSVTAMEEMSAKLGSDVPFLLKGGTAAVTGRGERIAPIDWPFDFTYVIVYPGFAVSTEWAYRSLKGFSGNSDSFFGMIGQLQAGTLRKDELFRVLVNDFESIVLPEYPVLGEIKTGMLAQGARASLLTGSGSSMVGIFENEHEACRCAGKFRNEQWSVFTVKASPPLLFETFAAPGNCSGD
ncbi:MAG: 4-(cytidine 5'-diphospho)-2-C-methyl-D-erythritol kinase [Candidatus Latescibacter sp.]|nr:4-(cytidine 5'-diphospho)-2-C-methyl-D-erythritol kinase [Candidatus Latescibacter sp.]